MRQECRPSERWGPPAETPITKNADKPGDGAAGTKNKDGQAHNGRVGAYQSSGKAKTVVGLAPRQVPWCGQGGMRLLQWLAEQVRAGPEMRSEENRK